MSPGHQVPLPPSIAAAKPSTRARSSAPIAYSIDEVAATLGVSERHVRRQIAIGAIRAKKCGKRTLILAVDLEHYLVGLPSANL